MKKITSLLVIMVLVLGCTAFAKEVVKKTTTKTTTVKKTVKKQVVTPKISETTYIEVSAQIRNYHMSNRNKNLTPKERIDQSMEILKKNNVSREDMRDYNMYLIQDPDNHRKIMQKIANRVKELQK